MLKCECVRRWLHAEESGWIRGGFLGSGCPQVRVYCMCSVLYEWSEMACVILIAMPFAAYNRDEDAET